MIEYQRVINYLRGKGYGEHENISEYWFRNHENCKETVNKKFPNHSQIFDLQVRWRSKIGIACIEALKGYIKQRINEGLLERNRRYQLGDCSFAYSQIDLDDFTFRFQEEHYDIEKMANAFPTSKIEGWHDLRGIPLDGIHLNDCALIGLNFSNASFTGANFQQVKLIRCNFVSANFDNSRFVSIRYEQKNALSGVSFRASYVNATEISNLVVRMPMQITELGYFEILDYLMAKLVCKKSLPRHNKKWTRFQLVDVHGLNDPLLRYQAEYINWSQSLLGKIDGFFELPITERISLLACIVFTKYWRSTIVLASASAVINLLFAITYMALSSHFKGLTDGFIESLYFSVVTFTTLGYGDITPCDDLARLLVILEVAIGYVALGSFLFILGQKVSQRY